LYFISHSNPLKGKELDNHKYYKRLETGKKGSRGQTVYRYFYSKSEWEAYNREKTNSQEKAAPIDKAKAFANSIKTTISRKISNVSSNLKSKGEKFVEKVTGKEVAKSYKTGNESIENKVQEQIDRARYAKQKTNEHFLKKAAQQSFNDEKQRIKEEKEEQELKNNLARKAASEKAHEYSEKQKAIAERRTSSDKTYDAQMIQREESLKRQNKLSEALFKKQEPRTTKDESTVLINSERYNDGEEYQNNCAYCSIAYDLRERGYDVEAKAGFLHYNEADYPVGTEEKKQGKTEILDYQEYALTSYEIEKCYDGAEFKDTTDVMKEVCPDGNYDVTNYEVLSRLENKLKENGNGSRGFINLYWSAGGGHSVVWSVENNQVVIRDCQTGTKDKLTEYSEYIDGIDYLRTDNLTPTTYAANYVTNR